MIQEENIKNKAKSFVDSAMSKVETLIFASIETNEKPDFKILGQIQADLEQAQETLATKDELRSLLRKDRSINSLCYNIGILRDKGYLQAEAVRIAMDQYK